jgi:hypothetical protein
LAFEAAISVPSNRASHFAFNRNTLTLFQRRRGNPVLPPRAANDATESRRVVLFCAVRMAAHIFGTPQTD